MKDKILRFLDGFLLVGRGIGFAAKEVRFWVVSGIAFVAFGTLMNLLAGGLGVFVAMGAAGLGVSLEMIGGAFLGLFRVSAGWIDWAIVFAVAFLQAVLIGLIVVTIKHKKQGENIERAGIAMGLAVLGAGCPTCGTALIAPVLGAIFAGGGAIIGAVSGMITAVAAIIIIISLRKVGEEYYVIIISERRKERKKSEAGD